METTIPGEEDLVILDVKWLCNGVLGRLLSYEITSKCRPTGCFGSDDFQILFSDCEAVELLQLLQALAFCTRCDLSDEEDSDVLSDKTYSKAFETPAHDDILPINNNVFASMQYNQECFTTEYEIPCLNFVETLGGLWDRNDVRLAVNTIYAGSRYVQVCVSCQDQPPGNQLKSNLCFTPSGSFSRSSSRKFSFLSASLENLSVSAKQNNSQTVESPTLIAPPTSPFLLSKGGQQHNHLAHLFPRIQVMLRRHYLPDKSNSEIDLYQWHWGSKYCRGLLEVLVTYESSAGRCDASDDAKCSCGRGFIELKYRGPSDMATELFEFAESIREVIKSTIQLCCPSLDYKQEILSALHLSDHRKQIKSYTQKEIIESFMDSDGDFVVKFTECNGEECYESLLDLLALGSEVVYNRLVPSPNLNVSSLTLNVRRKLASLLDPVDVTGCDWCMLAILLGLSEQMPSLDSKDEGSSSLSKTDRVLAVWTNEDKDKSRSLIGILISKLKDLNRVDAVDILMSYGSIFVIEKADSKSDYISDCSHDIGNDQYANNGLYKQFCDTNGFDSSFASADYLF